jgi:16S rRNA (guanine527-N7)-methyltransferase
VLATAEFQSLRAGAARLGLALDAQQLEKLHEYLVLLGKWNAVYNLTALREPERWVTHHLLDCLAVVPHLPPGDVVDVGSGAGLPGLPLAVACPDRSVVLLDSSHKRGAFLQQVVNELALDNAQVAVTRVEAFRPDSGFGVVISRAFAELTDFVRCARHLAASDGRLLAMKGVYPHEELAQLPTGGVESVVKLDVPDLHAERHLVVIDPARLRV